MKWRYPRIKRALLIASGSFLALAGVSYARALLAPNSPGWDLRSAEWVRDHHGGWALDIAEWAWLSVHEPNAEELQATQLSPFPQPFSRQRDKLPKGSLEPPRIPVIFDPPLPLEGTWRAIGSTVNGVPTLRCAFFRPDPDRADVYVAVARFTPELTRFVLVPGTRDPGGEWRWHGGIPEPQRESLLSAFNSGFNLEDAQGGFYAEGKEARPLVGDAASLVIDRDGVADIVAWKEGRELTLDIASVRQNLRLIVAEGDVSPGLPGVPGRRRNKSWNKLHNGYLWRSGLGIDANGAILYVAGQSLTLLSLAKALHHAGAVRAMELDIHQQWPAFNVFQPTSRRDKTLVATKLLKNMRHPATRYLAPDDRDFIAAFVR